MSASPLSIRLHLASYRDSFIDGVMLASPVDWIHMAMRMRALPCISNVA